VHIKRPRTLVHHPLAGQKFSSMMSVTIPCFLPDSLS
jgi:hypothetical protein